MNFDEVREYMPGDEVRTIDWNVTARSGKPFVKKFTEERELTIFLMVDVSASGNFGSGVQSKRELAAELASVIAFSAIRNNDKVGLLLVSDGIDNRHQAYSGLPTDIKLLLVNGSASVGSLEKLNPIRFESVIAALRFIATSEKA